MVAVPAAFALGTLVSLAYPRAPFWQIKSLQYKSITFNLDFTANAIAEMELELHNPNIVSTHVSSLSVVLQYEDKLRQNTATFGSVQIEGNFDVPAHGTQTIHGHVIIDRIPASVILSMIQESRDNKGIVAIKTPVSVDLVVLWKDMKLEAKCVHYVQGYALSNNIKNVNCKYIVGNAMEVPVLRFYENIDIMQLAGI
eukprot:418596_1